MRLDAESQQEQFDSIERCSSNASEWKIYLIAYSSTQANTNTPAIAIAMWFMQL